MLLVQAMLGLFNGSSASPPSTLKDAPDDIRACLLVELANRLCWYGRLKVWQQAPWLSQRGQVVALPPIDIEPAREEVLEDQFPLERELLSGSMLIAFEESVWGKKGSNYSLEGT